MSAVAVARLSFANGIRQPMTCWLSHWPGAHHPELSFGMFSFEDSSRMRLLITVGVATTVMRLLLPCNRCPSRQRRANQSHGPDPAKPCRVIAFYWARF